MNYFRSFLQMDQVKMNNFNDYVYHFLQLIQVKKNNLMIMCVCVIYCN